ncbi:uncharacterized protein LOC132557107 [Ylistrum balloti]|uniref:uncharacterized protein LOC132557107 n=1 Tax=Ylistrum balloti TaxID=509963 RepID=UPI002905C62A|nr:uncharacterized protein LOC132557107 [Ylistrum balloti]
MAANMIDSDNDTASDSDLNMSFEESDYGVDYISEDGIQPYRFEPELQEDVSSEEENNPSESDDRLANIDWCQCNRCQLMPTTSECVCCEEISQVKHVRDEVDGIRCITDHPGFQTICLDIFVLRTAYEGYRQYHNRNIPESLKRYRYTAYRQLARWCWGFLGKNVRVPHPSCAVSLIRRTFPAEDDKYTGFNYSN